MAKIEELYLTDIKHSKDHIRTEGGNLETISGIENVRQALFHRLITEKGSIVHRPLFGVGAKQYQNVTMTLAKKEELALEIKEQFEQDERVEEVTGVLYNATDFEPEKFSIILRVNLVGYGEDTITFTPFGD